jgi:hypothetical protein
VAARNRQQPARVSLQRCKNLSKEKANVFKREIIKQLQELLNKSTSCGNRLRRVDLEMLVEKTINDTLGASVSGDPLNLKLAEFFKPIREWRARSAKELDEIVAAVPLQQAADDLLACRFVIDELKVFITKLEARINDGETHHTLRDSRR